MSEYPTLSAQVRSWDEFFNQEHFVGDNNFAREDCCVEVESDHCRAGRSVVGSSFGESFHFFHPLVC